MSRGLETQKSDTEDCKLGSRDRRNVINSGKGKKTSVWW